MSELKRMKRELQKAKKPRKKPARKPRKKPAKKPAKKPTSRPKVTRRMTASMSRKANMAWSLPRGTRTRTARFGPDRIFSTASGLYSSAAGKVTSGISRVKDINRRIGQRMDKYSGGKLSKLGNTDYAFPAALGAAVITNQTRKTIKYLTNRKYKMQQQQKKLRKEARRLENLIKKKVQREAKVANRLDEITAALDDAKLMEKTSKEAKRASKRILRRRGVGFGGYHPVVYSPVAARAQQSLVVPCSGAYWV